MLRHGYIGTEHLLLGLIHEGEGVAAQVLERLEVGLAEARARVEAIVGEGRAAPSGHIPFTPRAKKVLELSLREAVQLGHNYIGTEHILLGMIREGEGVAAQVLTGLAVDLATARREVVETLSAMGMEAAAVGETTTREPADVAEAEPARIEAIEEPEPICPRCDTPLASSIRVRTIAAEGDDEASANVRIAYCGACGAALGVAS